MIARLPRLRAPAELGDRQQQQSHADQLQDERKRLLDPLAAGHHGGLLGRQPEAQSGNHLLAPRTIEQVQGHHHRRDGTEQNQELPQREVQKIHQATPRARTRGPKITSSMGWEVDTPT